MPRSGIFFAIIRTYDRGSDLKRLAPRGAEGRRPERNVGSKNQNNLAADAAKVNYNDTFI